MKRILIIVILCNLFFGYGQEIIKKMDDLTINGEVLLGKGKSAMISTFGQPSRTEHFNTPERDLYFYPGLEIMIVKQTDRIIDVRITDSRYTFTKHNIRVGQDVRDAGKKIKIENDKFEDGVSDTEDNDVVIENDDGSFSVRIRTERKGDNEKNIKKIVLIYMNWEK